MSMEPLAKHAGYYKIESDESLKETAQEETDITKLAQHVIGHISKISYRQMYDIRELFYERYKGKIFGGIRNFFYLLFNRKLKKDLDIAFIEKTKSRIPLRDIVELLPEFREMKEPAKQAIYHFLEYIPLSGEKKERLENALRQGTLEPIYKYLRSNIALMKRFPECIEQGALLRGSINIARSVDVSSTEGDWVDDFVEYEKYLLPGQKETLEQESLSFVKNFCLNPKQSDFRLCFRHLYTLLHLLDEKKFPELFSQIAKVRPFIQAYLPDNESSHSSKKLLLRAIELLESKIRARGSDDFMPELGLPSQEGPTFRYAVNGMGQRVVEAENPVKRGSFVTLTGRNLVPLDEKEIGPRLIGAYHLLKNGSFHEALDMLPFSLCVSYKNISAEEQALFEKLWQELSDAEAAGKDISELSLRLASIQLYNEKPLKAGESPSFPLIMARAEALIKNAEMEQKRFFLQEVLSQCQETKLEIQSGVSFEEVKLKLEQIAQQLEGDSALQGLMAEALDVLKSKRPLSFEKILDQLDRVEKGLRAICNPKKEIFQKEAAAVLQYFGVQSASSFVRKEGIVEAVSVHPIKGAVRQEPIKKRLSYNLLEITDLKKRAAFKALADSFGIPCATTVAEAERLQARQQVLLTEKEKQIEEEYWQLAEEAFKKATETPAAKKPLASEYQALLEPAKRLENKAGIKPILDAVKELKKKLEKNLAEKELDLLVYTAAKRGKKRPLESGELMMLYALGRIQEEFPEKEEISAKIFIYLQAKQAVQKANRSMEAAEELAKSDPELFHEKKKVLLEKIQEQISYDQKANPLFHVFEVLADKFIRKEQFDGLQYLGDPGKSVIVQMLMGKGKSAVSIPLIALLRADGTNISTVMLREPLLAEASGKLRQVLGRGFDQYIFEVTLPQGREITLRDLEDMERKLSEVQKKRGCLLLSADKKHILSNTFTALEVALLKKEGNEEDIKNKILVLTRILSTFERCESVISDEIDDILKTTLQYIIPLGAPKHFDQIDASLVGELVLQSVETAKEKNIRLDFAPSTELVQMTVFTPELYHQEMKEAVVNHALDCLKALEGAEGREWTRLLSDPGTLSHIKNYLLIKEQTALNQPIAEAAYAYIVTLSPQAKDRLAGLRFSINTVLPTSFFRNYNQEYGCKDSSPIAMPFSGPDHPTDTQFSNPYEQAAYSVQAQLNRRPSLDRSSFMTYLCEDVFPKIEVHEGHIASDPHMLVDSSHSFSGMSGTLSNITSMPGFEKAHIYSDKGEEASSLMTFYEKEISGQIQVRSFQEDRHAILRKMLFSSESFPLALIDSGGWMRGLQVLDLAKEILQKRADLEAVVFYDKKGNLVVLEKGEMEAKPFSPESEAEQARKGKRFTIYSEEYATGADISQHEQARALLTLDKKMTLRDFRQAIFRMRKIQEQQACTILLDRDMQSYMEQALAPEKEMSHLSAVVRFLIKNEVAKRLDENYQSSEQRVKNSIQASLRRAMFDLLLRNPPDFDKALSILKEGEIFFIQKDAISPFERYGKIPKPIARREWIDNKQKQYAASFQKLAQIAEVQEALGKRGETEEAIAEFLQQEISKLYVESQFEESLLESDPQLEIGRVVHVQTIISQESIQKSLLQVGEMLADCDRVLDAPIVHTSALAVQESLRNAIKEAKVSWQLQTSTLGVKNQEVSYQEADQLFSLVHRLRFHLDACHTLDRYEAQAEAVLRKRSEPITRVCDDIERLLAQLAACNVTKPIGGGIDRLNELVQEGERLLLAEGVSRQGERNEEERRQALKRRLEIGLQSFQGKELSVSHQTAVKSYSEAVLTEESVRETETALRQILSFHEASMELQKALILVSEGSLHEALLQWKEAFSSSLSMEQERKHELESVVIHAIVMSDNKESLRQLVRGAVLSRTEFQEINKACIQRLFFIEKRDRAMVTAQGLLGLFPTNKEIEEVSRKITAENLSLEDLDALSQRLAFLKKNADLMLESKGIADGLLAAATPMIGPIGKRAEVLWKEVYAKASLTLSSQAVEEVRLVTGEVERVLSQAASFSACKAKGLDLVASSVFRFNPPPFGRLKESMQKGHRIRLSLQEQLQEKNVSILTSSLVEIAAHFQAKREALDQAIQGLQTETETFTQEQAALLHGDQDELRSLVQSLRHDLAEVHVSEEKKEEMEALLLTLDAALEDVPLEKYSALLNKKRSYGQAKAFLQELLEIRQREMQDQASLAYLKKEFGLKKSAFELQGIRSEYSKRLSAIPSMVEMGRKMAAVASTKEKIIELEHELEVADSSFRKLKQKMEEHSSLLTHLPQLKLFATGRLHALNEKTLKLEHHFRQCQATKKDGEPRKIASEIQAELIEYEKEVLALTLLSLKGEQVYAFLDRTSPLSEKDQKKVIEILRELFLDNQVMNMGEMMDTAHIAAEKNVETRQIKERWNRMLVTFFQGLAVNEELFAEAVSFLRTFLPDTSRRAEVLSLLTEKRQSIEIAAMKDRCEGALRNFQLGEAASFSEVQDQFKIFMTALQSEISVIINRHRAIFSQSELSLQDSQDTVEHACRDAIGSYQLQAVSAIAAHFESHLEGVSLTELEARCDFVRFYSRVAAAIQLRGDALSQTKEIAGRSAVVLQRSERTLFAKIHEEESLIWRQEAVAKVARIGKSVLRNTAIMGLGAFIAQIPGFSEVGREFIGHGYQGAIMSVAQPIVQGIASKLPPSLQIVSETLLLGGVSLLAAQGQEFVSRGAVNLAGRAINPITRYVGESRLQRQLESQIEQERSQEPERREQLKAEAHKELAEARASREARQLQEHEAHEASVKRHVDRAAKRAGISEERTQEDVRQTVQQMTPSERAEFGRTHVLTSAEAEAFHSVEHVEALEAQAAMEMQQKRTPGPSGGIQEEPQAANNDDVHMKMPSVVESLTAQPSILGPMGAESSTFAYFSGTVAPDRFEIPSKITSRAVPSLAPPLPGNSLLHTASKMVLAFFRGVPKG